MLAADSIPILTRPAISSTDFLGTDTSFSAPGTSKGGGVEVTTISKVGRFLLTFGLGRNLTGTSIQSGSVARSALYSALRICHWATT